MATKATLNELGRLKAALATRLGVTDEPCQPPTQIWRCVDGRYRLDSDDKAPWLSETEMNTLLPPVTSKQKCPVVVIVNLTYPDSVQGVA